MNHRQRLALVAAVAAALTLAFGSAGFTSVSAQRGVSVAVVDDDEAFVGYQTQDVTAHAGAEIDLVTVTNRFAQSIDVVDVTVDGAQVDVGTLPTNLGSGESATVTGTLETCPGGTVAVTITVEGSGVWARIYGDTATRNFRVTCEAAGSPTGYFKGAGTFELEGATFESSTITYWTLSNGKSGDLVSHEFAGFDPDSKQQRQLNGNTKIVAVYVEELNVTFIHPNFDRANATIDNWGSGQQAADAVDGRLDS